MNTILGIAIGILLAAVIAVIVLLWQAPTHPRPCQLFEVCEGAK